jgi:hypothetical protein
MHESLDMAEMEGRGKTNIICENGTFAYETTIVPRRNVE